MKKRTKNLLIASSIFATITNYTIAKEIKYHQIINNHEHSSTGPEIIAHRGFSGDTLENSNEAIEKADQNECTNRIEIDVRLTADETIVLSHDNHDINTTNFVDLDLPTTKKNQYLILENLLNFDEMTLTKLQRQITKIGRAHV